MTCRYGKLRVVTGGAAKGKSTKPKRGPSGKRKQPTLVVIEGRKESNAENTNEDEVTEARRKEEKGGQGLYGRRRNRRKRAEGKKPIRRKHEPRRPF